MGTGDDETGQRQTTGRRGRALCRVGVIVTLAGTFGLLLPVLFWAPAADDRYHYLLVLQQSGGTYPGIVDFVTSDIAYRLTEGRMTPVGFGVQRFSYLAVAQLAATTGLPVMVGHALVKVLMLALAVLTLWGLAGRLRVVLPRRATPSSLSPASRTVLTLVFTVLVVCGAQLQHSFRNSWTAYPVLTMGAAAVCLGTVWAALAVADCWARGERWWPLAPLALALLGVTLALSYELWYVAVPLALIGLLMHTPAGPRGGPGLTPARWGTALALLIPFAAVLAWTRVRISRACALPDADCYVGTQPDLGLGTVITFWRNLTGAIPGAGRSGARDRLSRTLPESAQDAAFTPPGILFGVLALTGLLLVVGGAHLRRRATVPGAVTPDDEEDAASQRPALVTLAVLALALAFGAALAMSLSAQAQDVVTAREYPYRHTVTTWAGLAAAVAALATLGLGLRRPQGRLLLGVAPLVLLVVWAAAFVYPVNAALTRSAQQSPNTPWLQDVYASVLNPRPGASGEEQRCALLAEVDTILEETPGSWHVRLRPGMVEGFEVLWDRPYCEENDQ